MNLISRGIGGLGSGQLGIFNLAKWELRTVPLTEKYVVIMLPVTADKQTEPPDSGVAEAAGGQNTML